METHINNGREVGGGGGGGRWRWEGGRWRVRGGVGKVGVGGEPDRTDRHIPEANRRQRQPYRTEP